MPYYSGPVNSFVVKNIDIGKEYDYTNFDDAERYFLEMSKYRPESEFVMCAVISTSKELR